MPGPLLVVRDLTAGYCTPVVGPLTLQVDPGEVVGIWGPNGSGKSTLLKAIASAARIFAGRVETRPGLSLGWLLQQPVRLDEMPFSGSEYLRYAGAWREPPARLRALLERRIDTLSGGQFQLLAVWAVLGSTADLILLDEPTNNLDPDTEAELVAILRTTPVTRAVLLVSHERAFLEQACQRLYEIGK